MDQLPPEFRAKYNQLRSVIDSRTGKPVIDSLGDPCLGLQTHPNGGQQFNFLHGNLSSFDFTGRSPVVVIYGPIYQFYNTIGDHESPFGRPVADIQDLPDGSRCGQFEGGHIHEIGNAAYPFPAFQCVAPYQAPVPPFPFGAAPAGMPAQLHQKWVELSIQRDPISGKSVAEALGPPCLGLSSNEMGGQTFNFLYGAVVSIDNTSPAFGVYGSIYTMWNSLGGVQSGWGRPLTDEQDTQDGGRCVVFEGGHIHRYGTQVRPIAAEQCTAAYKPLPRFPQFGAMPAHFQAKWSQLAVTIHPLQGKPLVELMGPTCLGLNDNPENVLGRHYHFLYGHLVSHTHEQNSLLSPNTPLELTQPFAVYGDINAFWVQAGGMQSQYGRPICDEQSTADGGRCSIFEGGHIHWYNGQARAVPAEQCTAQYQPKAAAAPAMPYPPQTGYQQPMAYQSPPPPPSYQPPMGYQSPPPQPSYQPPMSWQNPPPKPQNTATSAAKPIAALLALCCVAVCGCEIAEECCCC